MKKSALSFLTLVFAIFFATHLTCYAEENQYADVLAEYGISNLEFDSDYAVITRDNTYNCEWLIEDYGAEIEPVQESLALSNVYMIAVPKEEDFEIYIEINPAIDDVSFGLLQYVSEDDLMEVMSESMTEGSTLLSAKFTEVGGQDALRMEAYIEDNDQYVLGYMVQSKGSSSSYNVLFKLYTYGEATSDAEDSVLTGIIEKVDFSNSPLVGVYDPYESEDTAVDYEEDYDYDFDYDYDYDYDHYSKDDYDAVNEFIYNLIYNGEIINYIMGYLFVTLIVIAIGVVLIINLVRKNKNAGEEGYSGPQYSNTITTRNTSSAFNDAKTSNDQNDYNGPTYS